MSLNFTVGYLTSTQRDLSLTWYPKVTPHITQHTLSATLECHPKLWTSSLIRSGTGMLPTGPSKFTIRDGRSKCFFEFSILEYGTLNDKLPRLGGFYIQGM